MEGADEVTTSGRTVDIELGSQEVITVDLDNLDPDPADILDLLNEGHPKVWVWTTLAAEYWRRGYLDAAEKIAKAAADTQEADDNLVAHARTKPKIVYKEATEDRVDGKKTKDDYYGDAAHMLNRSDKALQMGESVLSPSLAFLTRGIQQLATRSMDDAMRSFDNVLNDKPTNLVALLGKGRILYARRNYSQALQTFQLVLRMNPMCQPDPRIGIGLCYWAMGNKSKAKAAWERSMEVNPNEWATQLLLGLESINNSKNDDIPEQERLGLYQAGIKYVEGAFKLSAGSSAAAANALCELFLQKGNLQRALKLAERTIQFADTLTVLTEGYVRAARIAHMQGNQSQAINNYKTAQDGQKNNILANLGHAQMQIEICKSNIIAYSTSFEATAILASLRALPRPEISSKDQAQERAKAKELFDRITRRIESVNGTTRSKMSRMISEDMDMYIEIAGLWRNENLERTASAVGEALRICQTAGTSDVVEVQLLNNLGALKHLTDNLPAARSLYENALMKAAALGSEGEDFSTTILYNLARVYEDQGEVDLAKDAYEKLLSRHPEYVDAKVRQAQMLTDLRRNSEAHDLLKQALAANGSDLNVRAFYTYFLIQSGLSKPAKDFVFSTLKDHDKHDIYSLCAAGFIMYTQARESRDASAKGVDERRRGFQRSTEFFEKALLLDPTCAYAAQGLAIVTAEDLLTADGDGRRNAREALDVFGKVRESLGDWSVYYNMGHCYYARDEYDRAIENYEAAMRLDGGKNSSLIMCLCRSWYAKAMKDQSYKAMQEALKHAQKAMHISPGDKVIVYNIAMIQQKSAEMLFSIEPGKRRLHDLQRVIDQAGHAQKLFASLASDKAIMVPYSRDIADQRRKYGDNMLKKADEHLAKQRDHELTNETRINTARMLRQAEREELERLEEERKKEEAEAAKLLAEARRIAREQAQEWTKNSHLYDSDDDKEKKTKRARKPKEDKPVVSGDEGVEPEPKKKRRGKLKIKQRENEEDGPSAQASEDDQVEKPTRKRKKRVVRDDEDEEEVANPRKKQFKSKEMLSDTDDEDEKPVPMDES
ncbi:hypothetical protein CPB85DRAFT_1305700 [Mucidula mucida]|nr:hypothetical protein CPB85DRAFT_1305700 [Mucidula mucida]